MPPLAYDLAAWLRHYVWLPFPELPGETADAAPVPLRNGYAAPLAGAIIGMVGGLALVIAAALGAADFVAAAFALLVLMIITGARGEAVLAARAEGRPAESLAPRAIHYGAIAVAAAVLLRVGALEALVAFGPWKAALTLAGAYAVSRAAAVGLVLLRPTVTSDAPAPAEGLLWLGLAGLLLGLLAVLPFFGIAAALAGIAAAAAAVSLAPAFFPRDGGENERDFMAVSELLAEAAFLIAVLAFATR